jgi:hypothetical protein
VYAGCTANWDVSNQRSRVRSEILGSPPRYCMVPNRGRRPNPRTAYPGLPAAENRIDDAAGIRQVPASAAERQVVGGGVRDAVPRIVRIEPGPPVGELVDVVEEVAVPLVVVVVGQVNHQALATARCTFN